MTWFRYLPATANPSISLQDTSYVYPILRRKINVPTLKQDILKDSWLFADISDISIDKFINSSLEQETKQNSYIVVYESRASDDYNFIAVKSHIIGDRIYFQTAVDHEKDIEIENQYSLYYKTDNIKKIKKTYNGVYEDYISCVEEQAEFVTTTSDIDETSFDVSSNTSAFYNFSYLNLEKDWENGITKNPGAKLIGTFTGPLFELFCNKGPNLGKFKLRIISLSSDATPEDIVEVDWQEIDLFSENTRENILVFSKTDLYYKDYIFEIKADYEKNSLSKNGKIEIDHYSYAFNPYATIGNEEVSPYLFGRIVSGGTV
jgi:hypothetical protein